MTKTDNHSQGFRPSRFPPLVQCVHFEGKDEPSEARERGLGAHKRIADLLQGYLKDGTWYVGADEPPFVDWVIEFLDEYLNSGWTIFAVEKPVDLLDEYGEKITQGTIDLVLERNREFTIIDWKTGDKSDYFAQLSAYTLAWWDLHPESKTVHALVAYVDLRETENANTSYDKAWAQLESLYTKWKNKENEHYTISNYCSWCGRRAVCPAWREQAGVALAQVSQLAVTNTGLPRPSSVVETKVDSLKNDPGQLETFILAWERCKALVEDEWQLKDALKTHMQTGFKADHFLLVTVKDKTEVSKSIDPEKFLQTVVKQIGTMRAAGSIRVDPEKALSDWSEFTKDPFPVPVTETLTEKPGYSYVRLKGKPGRGDAAKKRKELE